MQVSSPETNAVVESKAGYTYIHTSLHFAVQGVVHCPFTRLIVCFSLLKVIADTWKPTRPE